MFFFFIFFSVEYVWGVGLEGGSRELERERDCLRLTDVTVVVLVEVRQVQAFWTASTPSPGMGDLVRSLLKWSITVAYFRSSQAYGGWKQPLIVGTYWYM